MRVTTTLLAALAAAAPLVGQQRPISSTDYYRLTGVGGTAMAPSGRHIAFTVTSVVEDKDRRHSEVWLAPTDSGVPYRITSPTTEAQDPRWSPDGSLLSFTSRRDTAALGPGDDQIWFLRTGQMGGEAFQIPGVNAAPVWSADSRWIAYVWGGRQPDSVRANRRWGWVSANAITRGPDPRRFDGRVITSMRYKADGRGFLPDPDAVPPRHIYSIPMAGGEARQLTDGTLSQSDIDWSPDGRTIAFVQDSTEGDDWRDDAHPDIYLLDVASGAVRKLTTNPGYDRNPAFSPDGRSIAYICSAGRGQPTDVCVISVDGGGTRNLTQRWELDPNPPQWSRDGRTLTFDAEIEGSVHLFRAAAGGGAVQQVTRGLRQMRGFTSSADGRLMGYTSTDLTHPAEVFVASGDGTVERRITSFNDPYLASVDAIPADTIWYRGPGGMRIEGWLMKPHGWASGARYPLVLYIHGGPHSQYGNVYFHEFQMLASQGYYVLFTNPRGSTGYGHAFTYASRGRWGMEDYQDLMLGVDEAIRRSGQVDTTRMAVLGGSYGGFMTNWIVGHTHRFRVAQTDRSISNWFSWYGSSDAQDLTAYEFYGRPWEQDSLYRALSPFTYVRNMTTPL
ncbi:MAG: S9 family peptidase, partial [Gemmatimonadota bacterium]